MTGKNIKQKNMAKITVNGKPQEVENATTLAKLIALNNITQPDMVSVQLNEEFVNREEYPTIVLKDGDVVDFLYFMGGGSR
ncbi:thiamine biosynthesis protein ThiS [Bacteroidia bacterium]|nr:thiamine biosynthesis protein ThiS [Bacteroidia bacterium]